VTLCDLVDTYGHFGGTYCIHLQGGNIYPVIPEDINIHTVKPSDLIKQGRSQIVTYDNQSTNVSHGLRQFVIVFKHAMEG
jgi:hypothetical protein